MSEDVTWDNMQTGSPLTADDVLLGLDTAGEFSDEAVSFAVYIGTDGIYRLGPSRHIEKIG